MKAKKIKETDTDKMNEIAEYLLSIFEVDIREKTKSKKGMLPTYRAIFLTIAVRKLNIKYVVAAGFVNKDHATVNHALKMWDKKYCHEYIGVYLNYYASAQDKKHISYVNKIEVLEMELYKVKKQKHELEISTNNILDKINNIHIKELLLQSESVINECANTRIAVFLKMLGSRKSYADLIQQRNSVLA